jgi:hypothetical protein
VTNLSTLSAAGRRAIGAVNEQEPLVLARQIAGARLAIGLAATLRPGLLRPLTRAGADSPALRTAWRLVGARDTVLGLGALLAARRGPEAVRGWLEAGAVADGVDAAVFVADRGLHPLPRLVMAAVAAVGAGAGVRTARRLTD